MVIPEGVSLGTSEAKKIFEFLDTQAEIFVEKKKIQ